MSKNLSKGEIIIYKTSDGETQLDVKLDEETVWLTQDQICILFDKVKSTISYHIGSIFNEGELEKKTTVRKYRTVQFEGKRSVSRDLEYYNLDVIISVGYRVKSKRGTQFRIWANRILKDIAEYNFDLIIANIQKNILLELAEGFKSRIKKGGILILSGLLEMDWEAIVTGFSKIGFKEIDYLKMDEWIGIVLTLH